MIEARWKDRLQELVQQGRVFEAQGQELQRMGPGGERLSRSAALNAEATGWFTSARHAIDAIFPAGSPYRTRAEGSSGFTAMRSLLEMALVEIDRGLVASLALVAKAEVFDDFLDQATHLARAKEPKIAGVLAGVVFEDAVRRACDKHRIDQKDVRLDQLISDLERASHINAVKAKRCRVAAHVRTKATHAQWDEFDEKDVETTIDIARELIDKLLV